MWLGKLSMVPLRTREVTDLTKIVALREVFTDLAGKVLQSGSWASNLKYTIPVCSKGNDGTNRTSRNNFWNRDWDFRKFPRLLGIESAKTIAESRAFFRKKEEWEAKYAAHSKVIVKDFLRWTQKVNFTTCNYEHGRIHRSSQMELPSLKNTTLHLAQLDPQIMETYKQIELHCQNVCGRVEDLMTPAYKESFNQIIINKIYSNFPNLTSVDSLDANTPKVNAYDASLLLDCIFQDFEWHRTTGGWITLQTQLKFSNGMHYVLEYNAIVAYSDEPTIKKLMETIKELRLDPALQRYYDKYVELQSESEVEIHDLKREVEALYDQYRGESKILPEPVEYPVCEDCPSKPSYS